MADHLFTRSEINGNSDLTPPWKRAEMYVTTESQFLEDHGPSHDARTDDDELIEIKSCITRRADERLGEFHIWEDQLYDRLGNGRIALLVYGRNDRHSVMATHIVDPLSLTDACSCSRVNHPTMGRKRLRRIPWPEVIPLEEVVLGARHHFAKYYPKEEVEDTFCLSFSDDRIRFYL